MEAKRGAAPRGVALVRAILFLVLVGGSTLYWLCSLHAIRESYGQQRVQPSDAAERETGEKALSALADQSETMLGWTVALLGGVVALSTTTKLHRIPGVEWVFVLPGPAASLLVGSIAAAVVGQRRRGYLVWKGAYGQDAVATLMPLVEAQACLLQAALVLLAMFAVTFMLCFVLGTASPFEEKESR